MQCRKPPEDSRQSPVGSLLPFMGTLGQETLRAPVTPVQSPKRLLSSPPEAERVQRPRLRFEDDSPPQEAVEDDRPPHLRLPPFSSLLKIADAGEAKNSRRAKTQPSSPSEDSCSNLFDPRTNPEHMQALSASSKPGLGSAFQFEPADKSAQNASDDGDTPPRRHNTSQDDSVVVKSPRTGQSICPPRADELRTVSRRLSSCEYDADDSFLAAPRGVYNHQRGSSSTDDLLSRPSSRGSWSASSYHVRRPPSSEFSLRSSSRSTSPGFISDAEILNLVEESRSAQAPRDRCQSLGFAHYRARPQVVASQPNVPLVRRTNDARVPSTPLSSLPGRSSYQQRPLSRDQSGSVKPRLPSIQQLKESNGLPDPRELGPPPQVPQVPPLIVPKPRKPQLCVPSNKQSDTKFHLYSPKVPSYLNPERAASFEHRPALARGAWSSYDRPPAVHNIRFVLPRTASHCHILIVIVSIANVTGPAW